MCDSAANIMQYVLFVVAVYMLLQCTTAPQEDCQAKYLKSAAV
jgi:hypothetical protein